MVFLEINIQYFAGRLSFFKNWNASVTFENIFRFSFVHVGDIDECIPNY